MCRDDSLIAEQTLRRRTYKQIYANTRKYTTVATNETVTARNVTAAVGSRFYWIGV